MELSGRVALVTGASRRAGIGAAICRELAAAGADIAFTHWQAYDRTQAHGADEDGPGQLAAELRGLGVRVLALETDISDATVAATLRQRCAAELGQPSILVNNATHWEGGGYESLDAGVIDRHHAVIVRATMLLSADFCRTHAGGPGAIVNLVSGQDLGAMPEQIAYATMKGAVSTFTRQLAPAVIGRGITVNAINPGPNDTGWMTDDVRSELLHRFPAGRVGAPSDVAPLVRFLAGPGGAWITGQVISAEGGFRR
ncbi:MAG: SDR family oxidoreductase [Candidatus Dormibacteria bacterium]